MEQPHQPPVPKRKGDEIDDQNDQLDSYMRGYSMYNQQVSLFEYGEVVVLKNYKSRDNIRVVSGGSSCHMEYVGLGMLTASIQGKKADPPTANIILRTLRELSVNHVKGILVIVQASSTDLINFGLATERAENDDLRVAFVGVSDDCKNDEYSKISEKRGLTGVVLVNKIAGAIAEDNTMPLKETQQYCSKVAANILSTGTNVRKMLIGTRECLYCKKCAMGLDASELRKSILKKLTVGDIISKVSRKLLTDLTSGAAANKVKLSPGDQLVLLVNNLGALNQSDQYVFFQQCLSSLNELLPEVSVVRFYISNFLYLKYDLDLTVTLLRVFDKNVLKYLDAECTAVPAWKSTYQFSFQPLKSGLKNVMFSNLRKKCRLSPPIRGPRLKDRAANNVQVCLQFACDALISCEKMLNRMDGEKGDGDTGTRLRIMADVVHKRSCNHKLSTSYPFTFFLSLSKVLEKAIGGTMGCLYSILFEACANTFAEYADDAEIVPEMWIKALENACAAIKKYGNVEMGDKTMYDPLQTCAEYLRAHCDDGRIVQTLGVGVAKAEQIAAQTKLAGCKFPDAGAHAVCIWLRAVCEGVKLRCYD